MSETGMVIVCPACGAKNRVDPEKADKQPVCGNCKAVLPMGEPVQVSDADFDAVVLSGHLPVLVDFWAPWCGPCRMVGPIVEEVGREYAGRMVVAKLNTDDNQKTASRFQIMGIPTLILFKDGQAVERIIGAVPKAHIEGIIKKHIVES